MNTISDKRASKKRRIDIIHDKLNESKRKLIFPDIFLILTSIVLFFLGFLIFDIYVLPHSDQKIKMALYMGIAIIPFFAISESLKEKLEKSRDDASIDIINYIDKNNYTKDELIKIRDVVDQYFHKYRKMKTYIENRIL